MCAEKDGLWRRRVTRRSPPTATSTSSPRPSPTRTAWYENDGSESFTAHTLTTAADGAASVIATDVDNDGDVDVFSASLLDDVIVWYENDGSQNFTVHFITTAADGAYKLFAADVDSDGHTDLLSASAYNDTIAWYENGSRFTVTPPTATPVLP